MENDYYFVRPYSKEQLAVWYYQETLKNKEHQAMAIHKAMCEIMLEVQNSKKYIFQKEFSALLRKYGILPTLLYEDRRLLLNREEKTLNTIRNRCELDKDGESVLKD